MQNDTHTPAIQDAHKAFADVSSLFSPVRLHAWDEQGLTVTQLRLLFHLSVRNGIGNAELADLLYVTRPSVSALLDRLERGGFIRREIDPQDRRGIRIFLEPRGDAAVTAFGEEFAGHARLVFGGLTDDELATLTGLLGKVAEHGSKTVHAEEGVTA